LAPIAVIVVYAFRDLLWMAVLSAAIWLLASMTARLALAGNQYLAAASKTAPRSPY
jgi:hypothetical protein